MPDPALLATVTRGPVSELLVRGHVAVADAGGRLLAAAGDPQALTTLRSCAKPLQALPFVRSTADVIGADDDDLAIACASHSGEPIHVAAATRLLGRAGLDESALCCGPQAPSDPATARQAILEGGPRRIHNNCSGKHAAMLATCVQQGWPTAGYVSRDHPCQRAVSAALAEMTGVAVDDAPWGIDGCGLPTYGLALATVARAFAVAQADPAFARCTAAMARRPQLVAGPGRFDTVLLETAGDTITGKSGAAGVWAAAVAPGRLGIAVKLEAGVAEALAPVAVAVLRALGVIDGDALEAFAAPAVHNWEGATIGEVRAEPRALAALAALGNSSGAF